jgi:hypothetical protein
MIGAAGRHILPALVASTFITAGVACAEVRVEYPVGGSGCQIVQFPRWQLPPRARERYDYWHSRFDYRATYDFRHTEDTAKDSLLVTVLLTMLAGSPMVSVDTYRLNLSRMPRVRRIEESEWNAAEPVISIRAGEYIEGCDECRFVHGGRAFAKRGKSWTSGEAVVLSSAATWVKLASLTVQQRTSDQVPTRAITFVEIYHVPSGKKVIALSGTMNDFNVDLSSTESGYFLDDRFYIAALSEDRRKMLICDMSGLVPKN